MADTLDMNKVLEIFNNVAHEVFTQMTQCKAELSNKYVKQNSYKSNEYSFIVGVTGSYEGSITMSMNEETAFNIVSAMMGNQPVKEFDAMAQSAISELINVMVGRSFSMLTENEAINITPPTFVRGSNVTLSVAAVQESYVIMLNTDKGVIEFNVSLFCT